MSIPILVVEMPKIIPFPVFRQTPLFSGTHFFQPLFCSVPFFFQLHFFPAQFFSAYFCLGTPFFPAPFFPVHFFSSPIFFRHAIFSSPLFTQSHQKIWADSMFQNHSNLTFSAFFPTPFLSGPLFFSAHFYFFSGLLFFRHTLCPYLRPTTRSPPHIYRTHNPI